MDTANLWGLSPKIICLKSEPLTNATTFLGSKSRLCTSVPGRVVPERPLGSQEAIVHPPREVTVEVTMVMADVGRGLPATRARLKIARDVIWKHSRLFCSQTFHGESQKRL